MDSPGRPVAFSAVRLGEWTRLEQGAFAKWMVGCPAHSGDTNRPGNTRNGFGGLTLCPFFGGEVAEARSLRCNVSVCLRRDASAGSPAGVFADPTPAA